MGAEDEVHFLRVVAVLHTHHGSVHRQFRYVTRHIALDDARVMHGNVMRRAGVRGGDGA